MRAFVVTVAAADVELAADHLFGLGVAAVEERSGADGTVELWTAVGDDDTSVAAATGSLSPGWTWRTVDLDRAVAERWRQFAVPISVGEAGQEVRIVPAWLAPDANDQTADADDTGNAPTPGAVGPLTVFVDPGAAFGLGDHPTTQLTLRSVLAAPWLVEPSAGRVLDVGCGSGVLGVLVAKRGATSVVGIDIATAAIEATIANAARNHVTIDASTIPLADVEGPFDLILANVLAPALIEMAADLRRVLAPAGHLVVSGILADRHQHVLDALAPLVVVRTLMMDGWAAVTLTDSSVASRAEQRVDGGATGE